VTHPLLFHLCRYATVDRCVRHQSTSSIASKVGQTNSWRRLGPIQRRTSGFGRIFQLEGDSLFSRFSIISHIRTDRDQHSATKQKVLGCLPRCISATPGGRNFGRWYLVKWAPAGARQRPARGPENFPRLLSSAWAPAGARQGPARGPPGARVTFSMLLRRRSVCAAQGNQRGFSRF